MWGFLTPLDFRRTYLTINETFWPVLRVLRPETRLTVYRATSVLTWKTKVLIKLVRSLVCEFLFCIYFDMFRQISYTFWNEIVSLWKKSIQAENSLGDQILSKFWKFQNAFEMTYVRFLWHLRVFKRHIWQRRKQSGLCYESLARKPGWRFTGRRKFWWKLLENRFANLFFI